MPTTKKCPYCAEQIAIEAVKCRFCNEWFDGAGASKTYKDAKELTKQMGSDLAQGVRSVGKAAERAGPLIEEGASQLINGALVGLVLAGLGTGAVGLVFLSRWDSSGTDDNAIWIIVLTITVFSALWGWATGWLARRTGFALILVTSSILLWGPHKPIQLVGAAILGSLATAMLLAAPKPKRALL